MEGNGPDFNDILNNMISNRYTEDLASLQDPSFGSHIEMLNQNLTSLITTELNAILSEKQQLSKEIEEFNKYKDEELQKLEQCEKEWAEKKAQYQSSGNESKIIEINVGGTHKVTTTLSTLLKVPQSALAACFNGTVQLPKIKGEIFIDREGQSFCNVISFLRTGKFPKFETFEEEAAFLDELDFWGIPYEEIETDIDQDLKHFDPNWCASTLILENNNTVLKKVGSPHGIAFGAIPMSKECPYVEFKISITSGSSNGSHIFLGLVDKSKYSSSQLVSTRWRDAPCSWYWDVWNCKLVKTDENGVHSFVTGYGCDCDDEETVLGIYYDSKRRTVSFYKKGINQGVAYNNVSSGLFPSIDVWFDTGSVTFLQTKLAKTMAYM
ncbi:unnamed protein product [Blepharisma stoltei]|uniref:BTB/POZ domain-containing protein n=1 Tax=Blepharisma stoltei TaxID=1481888 RepID=A0AAU9JH92_9CILI|nr:unnamed protein product [Blepharisma stoltei]